ncbi:DUF6333 family protein [Streptomyces sp. NPDC002851]
MARTTDTSYWDVPPETEVRVNGEHTLTVVGPGTLAALKASKDRTGPMDLPPHDPVAARKFAESFGTVDTVLETLPPGSEYPYLGSRDDLDFIEVGHWGDVISISDPALADSWGNQPLLTQAASLRTRSPDALIVGAAWVDCGGGMDHMEYAIHVPGGPSLEAEGWHGEDPWTVDGDPREIVRALGITAEAMAEAELDLEEEQNTFDWDGLCDLALGPIHTCVYYPAHKTSLFRVRHTEGATFSLEETWLKNP